MDFFATTPRGLAELLATELSSLGATACRPSSAGVYFQGSWETALRACLWSRLAGRVLLPLASAAVQHSDDLYDFVSTQDWPSWFGVHENFAVRVVCGPHSPVAHSHFAALRCKDAVVDCFRRQQGCRPNVALDTPFCRIDVHLQTRLTTLSLEISAGSLHRRGYRQGPSGAAPLKENLAAALLLRSCNAPPTVLVDPLCGSATLLIEAASMALERAPGLLGDGVPVTPLFAQQHATLLKHLIDAAQQRAAQAYSKHAANLHYYGSDQHAATLQAAREAVARAGFSNVIQLQHGDVRQATPPPGVAPGHVISNLPFGNRLGDGPALAALYAQIGARLQRHFADWQAHLLVPSESCAGVDLGHALGLRATRQHHFFNGALPCKLLHFNLQQQRQRLVEPATELLQRLRKNLQHLGNWAQAQQISCYRLYDRDLPQYNFTLDYYAGRYVVLYEYLPPASVDAARAQARRRDVYASVPLLLPHVPASHIFWKSRQRQRGTQQYNKLDDAQQFYTIHEGAARFYVNFRDYHDCGIFLDQRRVRALLAKGAAGKTFLNLFGYTATATVSAALGGATYTESVDLSATYLRWARRNLQLNHCPAAQHQLHQADCLTYLQQPGRLFDLMLVDPPSFSNSKRLTQSFDVQRDHLALLQACRQRLTLTGQLIFTTNLRQFKLHSSLQASFHIRELTTATTSRDFARHPQARQCYVLRPR